MHSSHDRTADVQRALIQAGLDVVTAKNFTFALVDVAATMEIEAFRRSLRGHELCTMLADVADALDPVAVAGEVGDIFADALVSAGLPGWAASIAGWGVARAAEGALSSMLPDGQLVLGLRVLGNLVCPRPSSCPAQLRLSVPALKELMAKSDNAPGPLP